MDENPMILQVKFEEAFKGMELVEFAIIEITTLQIPRGKDGVSELTMKIIVVSECRRCLDFLLGLFAVWNPKIHVTAGKDKETST